MTDGWTLVYDNYDPEDEGLRETLCALGNGYFVTRGACAESVADGIHYPGTYVAGLYNTLATPIHGRDVWNEDLVNVPNWLPLQLSIDGGETISADSVELLDYRQQLDLTRGLLTRTMRFKDAAGRSTRLESMRIVSMSRPHLACERMVLVPEDWDGTVQIVSTLDGRVINAGVERYRTLNSRHLEPRDTGFPADELQYLSVQANRSHVRVAVTARTRVYLNHKLQTLKRDNYSEAGLTRQTMSVDVHRDQPLAVEKLCALYTSRDRAISDCGESSRQAATTAPGFAALAHHHQRTWAGLWDRFNLNVGWEEPDEVERSTLILRLHLFHLLQTVSLHSDNTDAGVPARGWHGEAYRGHVFWDELFILPVLNVRMPELTRAMLKYRYRRLPAARTAALAAGFAGAMFPWQSASDGTEQTQTMHLNPRSGEWITDRSHLQRHVGIAIAWNIWQYYQATAEYEFLGNYGAEMLLEIARFWSSLATWNEELQRYEIHGVMGPDEYHDGYPDADEGGLSNNAYTNVMVAWLLWRVFDLLDVLPESQRFELRERLSLNDEELQRWDAISRGLRVVFHDDGIISQFEGYGELEEFDWEGYRKKYGDIRRLDRILGAEGDTPNRYKLSKQADVLMLFYLLSFEELHTMFDRLGYRFDEEQMRRNVHYYLARTSGGSTLSEIVHAHVLAQLDPERSWKQFQQALRADIDDIQGGTTREGIHLGAMAGTVDLLQRCYVGLDARADALCLDPHLPAPLTRLELTVHYRGHALRLAITRDVLEIRVDRSRAPRIKLVVQGQRDELGPGEQRRYRLS